MIDSAIIVTENISQYRERGYSLKRSCAVGTTEMITPMLSSSLTTIAVFVPLIFMSGIAGAIFMDQAFSITVGLMISYITGIMLLPVLYLLFYKVGIRSKGFLSRRFDNLLKNEWLESFYDKGLLMIDMDVDSDHIVSKSWTVSDYSASNQTVKFDKYGNVWLDFKKGHTVRLKPGEFFKKIIDTKKYRVGDKSDNLVRIFEVDGELIFTSGKTCFLYNPK